MILAQRRLFRPFLKAHHVLFLPRVYQCRCLQPFPSQRFAAYHMATHQSPPRPQAFPSTGFDIIDPSEEIEEETIPTYRAEKFYPFRIGEVFISRYQVVGKLGYGSSSTIWLCHDLLEHRYIALKVYITSSKPNREIAIYNHLSAIQSDNSGQKCLRMLHCSFEITGPRGCHTCLVHQPLGISLSHFKQLLPEKAFDMSLVRPALCQVLAALIYLHTVAHIIHTDIQLHNILLGIKDESVLLKYEQAELKDPTPRKVIDGRVIYVSRPLPITSSGVPLLCDLGEARLGDREHNDDIMPDIYGPPK